MARAARLAPRGESPATTVRDGADRSWVPLFAHLRLHYQLVFLSPLFAWGFFIGARAPSVRALVAFVSFHVFLYGGLTAYNSYYDRDEGPVGGLRVPPPVTRELLIFSIAVQVLGFLLAAAVGLTFSLLYLAIAALSVFYSHPRFRWKAKVVPSLLVVAFGQGTAGFAAGLLASGGEFPPVAPLRVALGAVVATFATVGMYPLTQLYQIDEDRRRGDRTFAVRYGAMASFRFSLACLATAGACLVALLATYGVLDAVAGALGFALLLGIVRRWQVRYHAGVESNFYAVHSTQLCLSVTTLGYVGFRLALG